VIAFECLLGRLPFVANHMAGMILAICSGPLPVPSLISAVPRGFDTWFARACARDLERRFPTAKSAAGALQALCRPRSAEAAHVNGEPAAPHVAAEAVPSGLKRFWAVCFRDRPSAAEP